MLPVEKVRARPNACTSAMPLAKQSFSVGVCADSLNCSTRESKRPPLDRRYAGTSTHRADHFIHCCVTRRSSMNPERK